MSLASSASRLGDYPYVMEASKSEFGLVFVGSFGRGVFYANVSALLRGALIERA